jgi:hypothetical protein
MTASPVRIFVIVAACAALCPSVPAAAGDHLACYKVKDTIARTVFDNVTLLSNNGLPTLNECTIKMPAKYCCDSVEKIGVPAQPGGLTEPGTETPGFCCYKVKCPKGLDITGTWFDQFGGRTVTARRGSPSLVCAPIDTCTGFGACSTKQCGAGRVCGDRGFGFCACLDQECTVPTPCGDAAAPTCDGACPAGLHCNAIDGGGCACHDVATACNGGTATCSEGECGPPLLGGDPGTCTDSGGDCVCVY